MPKRSKFVKQQFLKRFSLLLVLATLSLLDLSALESEFSTTAVAGLSQVSTVYAQAAVQETDLQNVAPSGAYEFTVVAKTDQAGLAGFGSGTGEEFVSINDAGTVAFIGRSSNNAQAVYVGDGSAAPEIISFAPDATRTYGPGLTIDNLGQVTVIDKAIYSNVYRTQLRRWIPGAGEAVPLVKGKATIDEIECPIASPNVCPYQYSNLYGNVTANNLGQIAFMALELRNPDRRFLVSYAPIKEYVYSPASPHPAFADDGYLVFRNDKTSPPNIVRIKADFSDAATIASAPNFSNLGQSPGVSDDGRVIVFYGELTQTGANALNSAQANLTYSTGGRLKPVKLCPGPGIFASVAIGSGTDTRRAIRRVAGVANNGCIDPGEDYLDSNSNQQFDPGETEIGLFDGFEPDMRVGVNGATRDVGIDTVVYLATRNGKTGIYANDLTLSHASAAVTNHAVQPNELTVYAPSLVAETGQSIPGLSGQVQKFQLYDPINVVGQIAFWADTGGKSGVVVAKLPIAVTGIEVTQAIQDLKNSVPLVKDKPTYVRVHIYRHCKDPADANCQPMNKVVGRLQIQSVDSNGAPFGPVRILSNRNKPQGITIKLKGKPDRAKLDDSFLFEVPEGWLQDTVEFKFSAGRCEEPANTYKIPNASNELVDNTGNCKVIMGFNKSTRLEVRFINVRWTGITSQQDMLPDDFKELAARLSAIYPIARGTEGLKWSFGSMPYLGYPTVLNLLNLALLDLRAKECSKLPACKTIYYGVFRNPLGGGLANNIPGTVASGGYTGQANIGPGRPVHAHEIAHVLGRNHAVHSSQGLILINGKQFKLGYCTEKGSLTAPDFPYSAVLLQTGVTHPVATLGDMNQGDDALVYGLDTHLLNSSLRGQAVVSPWLHTELMSYCGNETHTFRWVSKFTYEGLYTNLEKYFSIGVDAATTGQGIQQYLLVSGLIDFANDTLTLEPIATLDSLVQPPQPPPGEYGLQALNSSNNVIESVSFEPSVDSEEPYAGSFMAVLASNPEIKMVRVVHNQQTLASISASTNAPIVQVVSPNGGENFANGNIHIQWTGADVDGNALTYSVQYSPDDGNSWTTLAVGWNEQVLDVPVSSLEGTSAGLIRVLATDGFYTAQDQSNAVFTVARKSPFAFITGPGDNDYYVPGQWINLDGDAFDYEDEDLADTAFVWRSDVDGELGSGRSLAVSTGAMSDGAHTITLRVTDSDGQFSEASIHIALYQLAPIFSAALGSLPTTLEFFDVVGGTELLVDSLPIYNSGDGELTWNATDDQSWIQLDATSGSAPHDLAVTVNPSGLAVGTYTGTVHINSLAANSPQTVTVTLIIAPNDPGNTSALQVDSSTMNFSAKQGENNPAAQSLMLNHTGTTSLTWTATLSPTWLHLSQTSGTTPATLDVSVDTTGLAAGTHQGQIRFTGAGQSSPLLVNVTLVVNPTGGNSLLQVNSTALNYTAIVGTNNPAGQTLTISSSGAPAWNAIVSSSWIKLSASEGTGSSNLQVSVDTTGLAPGIHFGQITILSDVLAEPIVIQVQLTLIKSVLQVNPPTLAFSALVGGANPTTQNFTLQSNATITWSVGETMPWLQLAPLTGTVPGSVTVTIASSNLEAGSYNGVITVNGTGAEVQFINVFLEVIEEGPTTEEKIYLPVVTR